jgi:hypothetical protein
MTGELPEDEEEEDEDEEEAEEVAGDAAAAAAAAAELLAFVPWLSLAGGPPAGLFRVFCLPRAMLVRSSVRCLTLATDM